MLNFSQIWTSLPNDAYRPMLTDDNECIAKYRKKFNPKMHENCGCKINSK